MYIALLRLLRPSEVNEAKPVPVGSTRIFMTFSIYFLRYLARVVLLLLLAALFDHLGPFDSTLFTIYSALAKEFHLLTALKT